MISHGSGVGTPGPTRGTVSVNLLRLSPSRRTVYRDAHYATPEECVMNVLAKARVIVIRAAALAAVLVTCAVGSIGSDVATTLGLSTLALTSATSAHAGWRRRWSWRT